jgi:16S rRNA (cytosine967-C5)-methyltransferase
MVNAVLRRLPKLPERWPDEATEYSLPAWLWRRWVARLGLETARAAGAAALRAPETYIRDASVTEAPAGCEATGIPGCWHLTGAASEGARRMDLGAQTVVPLLDLQPGHLLLDVCAAPGNKTAQALETCGVRAIACDASAKRLRDLVVQGAKLVQLNAAEALPFGAVFDRILVDAPCSGTGTLGRNPEIRWRLTEMEIQRQAARQKRILGNALAVLKPGGRLVYATCSLEPEENEEVVRAVAAERVRAESLRVPGREAGDGFYAAVLEG